MPRFICLTVLANSIALAVSFPAQADPPVASYMFPAGGRRGTAVPVRVGGLNLHSRCGFELLGPGVTAERELKRMPTLWFEGPLLPIPESQQQEDYPKDMAARITIAADAALGVRPGRLWTAQGAASGLAFVVGDLPEVVEKERDGPEVAEIVTLPVTINGRIFPREDVDEWSFSAKRGQTLRAELVAGRFGSPLEPQVELLDAGGQRLAENDPYPGGSDASLKFQFVADGTYRVRIFDIRASGGPAFVYRLTLQLDAKPPEFVTTSPGKTFDGTADIRGRIAAAGQVDTWIVSLKKGVPYEFDLHARRLDSPLRPVMVIRDSAGNELARFDSVAQNGAEPMLRFQPANDGVFRIEVADRFANRGGPAFVYRLKIGLASDQPDFRLSLAGDTLSLPRAGRAKLKVTAERTGKFNAPIELTVDGLPAGVTATKTTLAPNQTAVEILLTATADAGIDVVRLTVRGAAKIDGNVTTHVARVPTTKGNLEIDSVLLAVTVPTPFVVKADYLLSQAPRGTVFSRHYRIDRNGFTGPLTVMLADRQARHLQGASGPTLVIPPDKNEFDYPLSMPPWMETGRTCRACIMAIGEIKDRDGRVREVSFSSTEQNMQIIVVVEPGRLGLELERGSVRAEPGRKATLAFRVQRGEGVTGAAKVELVESDSAVSADPVTLTTEQSAGILAVMFGKQPMLVTTTITVRATVVSDGKPIIAEAKFDAVPSK